MVRYIVQAGKVVLIVALCVMLCIVYLLLNLFEGGLQHPDIYVSDKQPAS